MKGDQGPTVDIATPWRVVGRHVREGLVTLGPEVATMMHDESEHAQCFLPWLLQRRPGPVTHTQTCRSSGGNWRKFLSKS